MLLFIGGVFFIKEQYQAVCLPEFGVYYITSVQRAYCGVAHEKLLDYYPLTYTVWGMSLLILHHSIPTLWKNVFTGREYQVDYP